MNHTSVSYGDMLPILLEPVRLDVPPTLEGVSLILRLQRMESSERPVFIEFNHGAFRHRLAAGCAPPVRDYDTGLPTVGVKVEFG